MESWRTTQIHERIDPPRGIDNIQSKYQNVGRKKQLQRQIQRCKMPKMPREYRNTGTCHINMSRNTY